MLLEKGTRVRPTRRVLLGAALALVMLTLPVTQGFGAFPVDVRESGAAAVSLPCAAGKLADPVPRGTFVPLILEDVPVDVVPDACLGTISPGTRIDTAAGQCTANFVFEDDAGRVYLGSAGHCHRGLGESVSIPSVGTIGHVAFMIDEGVGNDFALIRIQENRLGAVNPAMCHWGGPTSDGGAAGAYETVQHYGFGLAYGLNQLTRAREGVGWGGSGSYFLFAGTAAPGDSGAALRHGDGPAIGVITHLNLAAPAFVYGTNLDHAVALAEADLGVTLTLLTAPVAAQSRVPGV